MWITIYQSKRENSFACFSIHSIKDMQKTKSMTNRHQPSVEKSSKFWKQSQTMKNSSSRFRSLTSIVRFSLKESYWAKKPHWRNWFKKANSYRMRKAGFEWFGKRESRNMMFRNKRLMSLLRWCLIFRAKWLVWLRRSIKEKKSNRKIRAKYQGKWLIKPNFRNKLRNWNNQSLKSTIVKRNSRSKSFFTQENSGKKVQNRQAQRSHQLWQ